MVTAVHPPAGGGNRAETLELLAMAWTLRADPAQAQRYCSEALELRRACGDSAGVAKDLNQLGNLRHRLGQYQEAVSCYREALDTHRSLDDDRAIAASASNLASTLLRLGESNCLTNLSHLAIARGRPEEALPPAREGREQELEHPSPPRAPATGLGLPLSKGQDPGESATGSGPGPRRPEGGGGRFDPISVKRDSPPTRCSQPVPARRTIATHLLT